MCAQKELHKISLRLLSLPASSAASERSFSTHGWIHNKFRNRLDTDRTAKIVCIAHNTKLNIEHNAKHSHLDSQHLKPSTSTDPFTIVNIYSDDDSDEDDDNNDNDAESQNNYDDLSSIRNFCDSI